MQRRLLILVCVACLSLGMTAASVAQKRPCPIVTQRVVDKKFKPGQVWFYQTRLGESKSTVTILRIDSMEKIGVIIHVRVDGLLAHNPRGDVVAQVEHMPFTRDAMLASVDHLIKSDQPLPILEGLERWQADCGGVYTISVSRAVDVMEKTLNAP